MRKTAHNTFVDELCDNRPSSRLMLQEAWETLSPETKVEVLFRVTVDCGYGENLDLVERALECPNAYIRYLAARSGWLEEEGREEDPRKSTLRKRLRADPSPLVQGGLVYRHAYSQLVGLGPDPEVVCGLPLTERVVLLSWVKHPAEWFPKVLRKAIRAGLPERELRIMSEEYLASHVANRFSETGLYGWGERESERGLGELWRLAAQLLDDYPECAYLFIRSLPTRAQGAPCECVPEDALHAMNEKALVTLLSRSDVDMGSFRAAVLVQRSQPSDELLEAAASRSVEMTNNQFGALLKMPHRMSALEYSEGLPMVMMRALKDCFRYKYGHGRFGELTDYPHETIRQQLAQLPHPKQRETIRELRKYQLATIFSPWPTQPQPVDSHSLSGNYIDHGTPWSHLVSRLQYPKSIAVPGDPWETYCVFGDYFDASENYEALRRFSSGYYPDDENSQDRGTNPFGRERRKQ
ncbi:MAG: hypothetical protein ABSF50_22690 [Burkholderiaceae bacterium]|jgi:hypothetical protein